MKTGPLGGVPVTSAIAMLMACPVSRPPGSKTMPTNGLGSGVGTGAGMGTISKWMSTPSTMSMKVLASIASARFDLGAVSVHRVRLREQAALAAHGGQRARHL